MKKVEAVILAGGQGKRMDLLCYGRPKPILPFAGRFRVIDFSLSNCLHSGISAIAVLVDYQRQYISEYLEQWSLMNASDKDFQILEPGAGSYKGTADAVYQNLDSLKLYNPEVVLVLAGDHVYRMDYRKMLAFHEQMEADVTVGVISVPHEQAHRFGIVTVDAQGRIIDFVEKPRIPASNLVSMGIYAFNRKVLTDHLIEDNARADSLHDFGHVIIPKMVKRQRVLAYEFDGYWQDIGTVEAYYGANMELMRELPNLSLNGKWPIFSKDNKGLPPQILHQGNVNHSLISPGCIIKGKVENSILSPGVIVEEQAVIRDSVIMADVVIGKHSVVDRSILDDGVNVGKYCYVGFGTSLMAGINDLTVLGSNMTIPSCTAVSRGCKIPSNARTSDFAASAIVPGSLVLSR